ncbi:SDR family NAD(P)-dependent oxidoreductase [Pelomonas sp. KK5]|uniref:SDR family NAD(P)-dependent oxidoreductase n=1 Tax=Pelomonas sp. KK5 TaxID=1855730 RepID=UPI00097BE73A|nr:SDR family NAD(P)-dependent oxidoreductase [Pelomonas sp. KK5]
MTSSLSDRVFVVTGGFGALGRALAAVLLEEGARVALLDRAPAGAGLPGGERVLVIGGADLGDAGAAAAAFAQVKQRWQRVDGLVNVAGGFAWETVGEGKLDTWDRLYAMNLRSAVSASQAALPHLSTDGRGRIVNIAALGAVKAATGMGAYAASKAGVMRLTEALAEELKDRGITVNAVLPSIIDTPANRADMPDAAFDRWVTPEALGRVIKFLLSDDAAAITGALLPVAGRT